MTALNCKPGEIAFVRTTCPEKTLHGKFGTCVALLGNTPCPCCGEMLMNMWVFRFAGPYRAPSGRVYLAGPIYDKFLCPIRPGKDPEDVDTARPVEGTTA